MRQDTYSSRIARCFRHSSLAFRLLSSERDQRSQCSTRLSSDCTQNVQFQGDLRKFSEGKVRGEDTTKNTKRTWSVGANLQQ